MKKKIWIDLLNPSHPLFFAPLIKDLKKNDKLIITLRERGETTKLSQQFGITGKTIGTDYENPIRKVLSIITRTIILDFKLPKFDYAISFENPMSVTVARLRRKKSILLLDNDVKYKSKANFIQKIESRSKKKADHIIIPKACKQTFSKHFDGKKIITYDGYKEDFYIADYKPNKNFPKKIPFKHYIVIRPEAMASFYVDGQESLVPQLLEQFKKEKINIVYLPRDKSDKKTIKDKNIFIPEKPLHGIDLIYHSDAVLTGSGTMAREAAVIGKTAVSFFPSKTLLSVDQQLIDENKMIHSRNSDEIIKYVKNKIKNNKKSDTNFEKSKEVKKEIIEIINKLLK